MSTACTLPDRAVLRLSGPDVASLLQGIITQDMAQLDRGAALFTTLLSAQGKFQHDFFLVAHGDEVLLDTEARHAEPLVKKLKMYRLRSRVDIHDETSKWHVVAVWGRGMSEVLWPQRALKYTDPRLQGLGMRALLPVGEKFQSPGMEAVSFANYDTHRLSLGVPDGWRDASDRNVAMELNYDQLNAISFTKGCYVGQEVTARMHYRNVLRKCLHQVEGIQAQGTELPAAGTPIMAGAVELGEMRSSQGSLGRAMLRIAELQKAQAEGVPIMAVDVPIKAMVPAYMQDKVAGLADSEDAAP